MSNLNIGTFTLHVPRSELKPITKLWLWHSTDSSTTRQQIHNPHQNERNETEAKHQNIDDETEAQVQNVQNEIKDEESHVCAKFA